MLIDVFKQVKLGRGKCLLEKGILAGAYTTTYNLEQCQSLSPHIQGEISSRGYQ